jgi:hypothetical protein
MYPLKAIVFSPYLNILYLIITNPLVPLLPLVPTAPAGLDGVPPEPL